MLEPVRSISPDRTGKNKERRQNAENIATGTAATGTVAYGSKKYVRQAFDRATATARTVSQNAKEASSLWGKFNIKTREFTRDIALRLSKFENSKYIGPIVKSKAVQRATKGFGIVTAFFVLVPTLLESIETGKIALNNAKKVDYEY